MPMFSLPNKKLSKKLEPIIKRDYDRLKYVKEEDPVYRDHVEKIRKILKKRFWGK